MSLMAEREPLTVVLAPSKHRFALWCQLDNNPPINPRGRNVICLVTAEDAFRRLRGRRKQEGDRVVDLGFDHSDRGWRDRSIIKEEVLIFERK